MDELEIERRLTSVEDRSKSNTKRLDKMEAVQETLTELVKSVATIAQKQADMTEDIKEMRSEVKIISGEPGKRWKAMVEKAIGALVAAMVAYALLRLGIG